MTVAAAVDRDTSPVVLSVRHLRTYYRTRGRQVPAVDGVDLDLTAGEVVGIVGESGSGKSTLARSIIRLIDTSYTRIVDGEVWLDGQDLLRLPGRKLHEVRGESIAMIFQSPLTALNPAYTVGAQITEAIRAHRTMPRDQLAQQVLELLGQVGIPDPAQRRHDFPHQLSGGMRQRVAIAIALACGPRVLLADEPTTALDVTIQAQVLELIRQLSRTVGTAVLLITHNMGVVAQMCERTLVMYGGVVVEQAATAELFANPAHPYTQGLIASIPKPDVDTDELQSISGTVPSFSAPVRHCRFTDRCPQAFDPCAAGEPPLVEIGDGHRVRCWLYAPDRGEG